jgi:hypothetical protein
MASASVEMAAMTAAVRVIRRRVSVVSIDSGLLKMIPAPLLRRLAPSNPLGIGMGRLQGSTGV